MITSVWLYKLRILRGFAHVIPLKTYTIKGLLSDLDTGFFPCLYAKYLLKFVDIIDLDKPPHGE
ncbi:hypothetical protein GCM10027185_60710 [Spirosoma pulveris]